ncbi:MAG: acetyl-CoA carboxylase biotin carboxyl carrier protein [Candidatus Bipolaricaulota bacterium]|nr:acetyl-CoA carboxylase biotin carboxyl carrier protein [Candidatus Bipolaricaulota bacterium]MCS7274680.1 acetyl-CoA carboxylase biotin carboxyl carrier protein [Candidatus Bipolaricaulota bacterium]MDW8111387.1 acetyl-CoA carboxylase biotin carboxyl carrier protein [Candidatus Bipolaricaulota bacterium]MDW8329368.1 acetyl-CoA carboxylase biotin carboxyl carrier protein [Candidatus Bipolaricaulota bacterium]
MDVQEIRQLIEIFERSSLSELVLERGGARLTLKREGTPTAASVNLPVAAPSPPAPAPAPSAPPTDGYTIKAPLVGTFYRRPAPNEDPYVEVGDRVEKGDIVCIIEAMKVMNEIKTDQAGIVEKILVEDGKPVEYGQPLILLRV